MWQIYITHTDYTQYINTCNHNEACPYNACSICLVTIATMMHGCSHLILAIAIATSTNKKYCISYTHTSYETEHFSVHDHRIVGLQSRTKCFMESNQLIIEL